MKKFLVIVAIMAIIVVVAIVLSNGKEVKAGGDWDKSSLSFSNSCGADCTQATAEVCNDGDGDMEGTVAWQLYYAPTGNPKDGSVVASGSIPALESGDCYTITGPTNGVAGNYMFRAEQRPGHPGTGELWSEQCTLSDECEPPPPPECDDPYTETQTLSECQSNISNVETWDVEHQPGEDGWECGGVEHFTMTWGDEVNTTQVRTCTPTFVDDQCVNVCGNWQTTGTEVVGTCNVQTTSTEEHYECPPPPPEYCTLIGVPPETPIDSDICEPCPYEGLGDVWIGSELCVPPPEVCNDPHALNYGEEGECEYPPPPVDVCNNIPGNQDAVPDGMFREDGNCLPYQWHGQPPTCTLYVGPQPGNTAPFGWVDPLGGKYYSNDQPVDSGGWAHITFGSPSPSGQYYVDGVIFVVTPLKEGSDKYVCTPVTQPAMAEVPVCANGNSPVTIIRTEGHLWVGFGCTDPILTVTINGVPETLVIDPNGQVPGSQPRYSNDRVPCSAKVHVNIVWPTGAVSDYDPVCQ